MEFLSTLLRQVSRIYGRLTASQRATFLLLLAMIVGSLVLLVVVGGGADWVPLTSGTISAEQMPKAAAELDRAGIAYRDRGGLLEVGRTDRYRALAALSQGNALPSHARPFGFNELVSQSAGFGNMRTAEEQRLQEQVALQTELERTLCEFQGVASARVLLSQAPRRRLDFGAPKTGKAAVTLWLQPPVELSSRLVNSVASLVQGAVLDLKPQNVWVIDAGGGPPQRVPDDETGFAGTLLEQKRDAEKYLRAKLHASLSFIPDLIADVCVELRPNRQEKTTRTVRPDESVIAKIEEDKSDRQTSAPPGITGPPAGTSGPATLVPAAAPSREVTETRIEIPESHVSEDRLHEIIPAGTIESITAVIVVPLQYYRKMLAEGLPEGQKPDEQQVIARAAQDKARIQGLARGALGKKARPEDITVDTAFVPAEPMMAAAAIGGAGAGRLAERYGATAVLVGLSVVFLFLLSRWVKRPAGVPAQAGVLKAAAAAVGAEEDESVLLPTEADAPVEVRRLAEMRRRIEELVTQDPSNAANLVSRWLNQQ